MSEFGRILKSPFKGKKKLKARVRELEKRVINLEMFIDILVGNPKSDLSADEIGFNGQLKRKAIFLDLLQSCSFESIIETGTWVGNTTGYMANVADLKIYTVEADPRFYSVAKKRLQSFSKIVFELSDSRKFLKKMSESDLVKQRAFFYLDAHWYELPLQEEIEIIARSWENFVIMIDDFQVPEDEGYGFDKYKDGQALTIELIANLIKEHNLCPFFPAASSKEETGAKRGTIILSSNGGMTEKVSSLSSLKRYNND